MKKLIALALSIASIGVAASAADAKTKGSSTAAEITVAARAAAPQVGIGFGQGRRFNRRARVVTQTRIVHRGRRTFRETYRVRYLPNGTTQTTLVSSVRVR
jgi:hypothetical protein